MTTRIEVIGLVDRILVRREYGRAREALTIDQLKDKLCELLVVDQQQPVRVREALVSEAGSIWAAGDGWQTRGEVEEFMREALSLPPAPFPDEVCEGSTEYDPCGLVEHHDDEGTPLCQGCWDDLASEGKAAPAASAEDDGA